MENDITIPFGIQVPEPSDLAPYLGKGIDLPTFGGRMSVQWDPNARVTSVAGLAHFGMFLADVGLFGRMAEDAPFDYASNNADEDANARSTSRRPPPKIDGKTIDEAML